MHQLFEAMMLRCASDLHLKAGCPPGIRVDGHLVAIEGVPPLDARHVETLIAEIAAPEQIAELKKRGDLEFALSLAGISRYRVSLVCQRGTLGAVLRRVPVETPDMVLVTGPTGSGKSTTLAALIDYLNREASGHILTMEDPIEFVHRDQRCFITQREIGADCASFEQALRRALRHDPDVIMIGELRDRETISLALTAAETGHLVLATMHTPGAVATVDRLLDAFPPDERNDARGRIASNLQGVFSQTLVPKVGGGRVVAVEVMVVTEAIRSCIREAKIHQIQSQIQTGFNYGMQTQTTSIADLVRKGMITEEVAMSVVANVEELRHQLTSGGASLRSTKSAGGPSLRRTTPPGPVEPMPVVESVATAPAPAASPPTPTHRIAPPNNQSILEKLRRS